MKKNATMHAHSPRLFSPRRHLGIPLGAAGPEGVGRRKTICPSEVLGENRKVAGFFRVPALRWETAWMKKPSSTGWGDDHFRRGRLQ